MCGIYGQFKEVDGAAASFMCLKHRGKDGVGSTEVDGGVLFHCLHAIVGNVTQPLVSGDDVLVANCEIYNWKELDKKYGFNATNDAETLFALLEKKGLDALDEVDGVYAFAWLHEGIVYLARDLVGVKPLCYSFGDSFAFSSEMKALTHGKYLLPTQVLTYDVAAHSISFFDRDFFSVVDLADDKRTIMKNVEKKLVAAVKKRTAGLDHFGILFSGGVDSTVLAFICKKLGLRFTCYTAAFHDGNIRESPDLLQAKRVAEALGLDLKYIVLDLESTEEIVKEVVRVIETTDVVKVGVALPFYLGAELAAQDGCKVLLSGLGSEELFAGYQRHKDAKDVNAECLRGLSLMWDRDLYRDDLLTMAHTVELRLPFLDHDLIRYSLGIPVDLKIDDMQNKKILRDVAVSMGLDGAFAAEKKRAAQYGSNFDKALEKLAKKKGVSKKEYLGKI